MPDETLRQKVRDLEARLQACQEQLRQQEQLPGQRELPRQQEQLPGQRELPRQQEQLPGQQSGQPPAGEAQEGQAGPCQRHAGDGELALLANLPDGYIRFERDFQLTFLNPAAERLYGLIAGPGEEKPANAAPVAILAIERSLLRGVFETGQPAVIEFQAPGAVIEARYFPQPGIGADSEGANGGANAGVQSVLALLRETTGRRRVIEAQQVGEQLIRAALAHVGVKVYTQDLDLCYKWIYDQDFGLLDQAYPGKTDEDFYAPEEAEQLNQVKRLVLETGESARVEMQLEIHGEPRTFDLLIEATRDAGGRVNGLLCSSLDITERKRTAQELLRLVTENQAQQEQLARQNELLQAIFDVDPGGLAVVTGPELVYQYANPAYRALLPHPEMDPIGRSYTEVWPRAEHFRGSWIIERVMQTGSPVHLDRYPQQFADGSTHYYGANLRRLMWAGKPAVLLALWDVTQAEAAYQQVEQAVETAQASAAQAQEGREILEALLEYAPEGIAITDPQGRIRYLSRYGREMAAGSEGSWQEITPEGQQAYWRLYHLDGVTPAATEELPLTRAVRHGENIRNEAWTIRRSDHELITIACNAGPIRDQQGRMIGGLITWQDVTERKQAEAELEQYASRLEISNRELEQFASVASHDLQEPLRKIQAFSDMLARAGGDTALPAGSQDILRRMNEASQRMQRMISDLLTFSRVSTQARPMEPVDLRKTVNEVLWNLEARLNSTEGRVIIGELPNVQADPLQMAQLFQNLISNALKYHRPDAPPVVKVYGQVVTPPGKRGKPAAQIFVEDNGIGFDPQYTARIFKPFERLHGRNEYEGSGMGLAICQKIIERHQGSITATSTPGEGATFIITLPVDM